MKSNMTSVDRKLQKSKIERGEVYLGIELGSTRIKAVIIDSLHTPIISGSFTWENKLEDGIWTYDLAAVEAGIQACYTD